MFDSTAKRRAVQLVGSAPCFLLACATGSGSPTGFPAEDSAPPYDAGVRGNPGVAVTGNYADDGSYAALGMKSCAASAKDASADADHDRAAATGAAEADGGGSVEPPSVGDLVITEIMFDPSGSVPEAQWFEVYNLAGTPKLLTGLTIADGWGDAQVIASGAPIVAPPFTYVVLVRDMATALSNGVAGGSIVFEYGASLPRDQGIELASDVTGDLSLYGGGGALLVDVPYGPWGVAFPGQSIELGPLQYANADQPGNWCVAQLPWALGSDDGTPGLASDCP